MKYFLVENGVSNVLYTANGLINFAKKNAEASGKKLYIGNVLEAKKNIIFKVVNYSSLNEYMLEHQATTEPKIISN